MIKGIALCVLFLTGCAGAAVQLQHTPSINMTTADAQALIEQVLMEQPPKFRPQSVVFSRAFFGTNDGTKGRGKSTGIAMPVGNIAVVASGSTESVYKELTTRVYYSSVGETKLFRKGRRLVVDIVNKEGYQILRAYVTNEAKARQYVDAVAVLVAGASKP